MYIAGNGKQYKFMYTIWKDEGGKVSKFFNR